MLSLEFKCKKRSSTYVSKAWGYESEHDYFNVAISIVCELSPHELLSKIVDIENKLGRRRSSKVRYMDRTIDIDIILFGDIIINTSDLVIPHPRFHVRNFCLLPMKEIAPDKIVPGFNETVSELSESFNKSELNNLICDKV